MVISAVLVLIRTARMPSATNESLTRDILPGIVILFAIFLIAFGVLLKPLGFLPTSALFLTAAIKILSGRNWAWTLTVALGSLVLIWLIFRIVFTVLMPAGIVPEAELLQIFRTLFNGEGA